MASIISAGTTSGTSLNLSADTSGVLQLATNGTTTAMTIDASQNVLVGTSSSIGSGQIQLVRNANDGNTRINISNSSAGSSAASYFLLGNDTAPAGFGGVRSSSSTNTSFGGTNAIQIFNNIANISLSTAGVERMNIPVAGGVQAVTTISVGNATPSSSGAGITFPATQSASSDANTLDDYEEGTWTPNVGGTATYSASNYGLYTKIGNVVTCQFRIAISSIGTGSTNQLRGLPFTSANLSNVQTGNVSYYENIAISTIFVAFYIENNATTIQFVTKATAGTIVDNGPAIMGNNTNILGTVTYRVA